MATFDFTAHLAVDPYTGAPAANASVLAFPPGTTDYSVGNAVPMTDLTGAAHPGVSTSLGVVTDFRVTDYPVLVLQVGPQYRTVVTSAQGLIAEATSAKTAALAASASAALAQQAAQSLASSSALPGGGTEGQALMRRAAGALGWGDVASTAARVSFVPTGSVTAANVQGAIEQLVTLGVGSGAVLVIRWTTAGWPAFPTAKPAASLVLLVGPSTAPAPGAAPSWAGWDAAQVPVLTFLGA